MNFDYQAATIALHSDREFEDCNGIAPAITQSVTYSSNGPDDFAHKATEPLQDRFYARHGNPTSSRIAKVLADLEGGESAMMFSSGMGAITATVLAHVSSGDHIVAQKNHYIGTTNLLQNFLPRFGVDVTQVDQRNISEFEAAIQANTKLIITETPVNPTMHLTDLQAVSELARDKHITTVCDNTFATPLNQSPISLGIDLVCHSVTKYIGGYHDLLAGSVIGSRQSVSRIWDANMTLGALSAPMNSWLALRGVRTLNLRVKQHNQNATAIAEYLGTHPKVASVHYPGLTDHPQHDLAKRQMKGFGGLLTFVLKGGFEAGVKFLESCKVVQNAGSLGGVDSLAIQPASMWAGRLPREVVQKQGILPGMIRFASGIEATQDLLADVEMALEYV